MALAYSPYIIYHYIDGISQHRQNRQTGRVMIVTRQGRKISTLLSDEEDLG